MGCFILIDSLGDASQLSKIMAACITDDTEIVTHDPLVLDGTPPACGVDTAVNAACSDPEWALDHPDDCPNSSPIESLTILPAEGTVQVAGFYGYRAIATFENGAKKDVTDSSVWSTDNPGIAAVFVAGLIGGIAEGTSTVSAAWRGFMAFATLNVINQCVMYGLDVAIVISRAASMNLCDDGPYCETDTMTRLQKAKQAAKNMVANLVLTDQVAVISFGGIIKENDDGTLTKYQDTTMVQSLTTNRDQVTTALDSIESHDPCVSGAFLNCCTGIGGGLQLAMDELGSSRAQTGQVQKVIVLLTDGVEQICAPDPEIVAQAAKDAGILVIIVALDVPDATFVDCTGGTVSSHEYLTALSSYGLAYFEDSDDLTDIFSRIPNIICEGGYGYSGYQHIVPDDHHYLDELDYTGFINWNVAYCVDLIGRDKWILMPPGHGAYVDLCGTGCGHPGGLVSKETFELQPGNYRLSMDLAGNQRTDYGAKGGDKIGIKLVSNIYDPVSGTNILLNKVVTILNHKQSWQTYTWDINVASTQEVVIEINERPFDIAYQTQQGVVLPVVVGALLDNVLLQNLDSGAILLYDTFDDENEV